MIDEETNLPYKSFALYSLYSEFLCCQFHGTVVCSIQIKSLQLTQNIPQGYLTALFLRFNINEPQSRVVAHPTSINRDAGQLQKIQELHCWYAMLTILKRQDDNTRYRRIEDGKHTQDTRDQSVQHNVQFYRERCLFSKGSDHGGFKNIGLPHISTYHICLR